MPKIKYYQDKWDKFWKSDRSYDESHYASVRFFRWLRTRRYNTPLEVEKMKYLTHKPVNFLGLSIVFAIGATAYIIWDRIYTEQRWLRSPGAPIYETQPFLFFYYWRLRVGWLVWIETHLNLNNQDRREGSAEGKNLEIIAMKEAIMKAMQIETYKKKRIDTFDFTSIGETEDFSLTL